MKKRGLIVKNPYFSSTAVENQVSRLREEFIALGAEVDIRDNDLSLYVTDGRIDKERFGYDFVIYLDKDKYALKAIENSDIPVFNDYRSVTVCDDKALTALALAGENVPMPETVFAPLCYNEATPIDSSRLDAVENRLGYPMIVKECYGSRGAAVYLVNDRRELDEVWSKLKTTPHLYQKFIEESRGRDLRVIVVGNEVLGGMMRKNDSDFRSNIAIGGKGYKYEPSEELKALSLKITSRLGLAYAGIDYLFGNDGWLLCEVNSNAFFEGFEKTTEVNVAAAYARYVMSVIDK